MQFDGPRTQGEDARRSATPASGTTPAPVLIVDDDDSIRETLRLALEEEGHEVVDAKDGASAIVAMRAAPQSLVVLLDHIMPGVDGVSMLRSLSTERELLQRHAYVLITASARIARLEEELGALPMSPVAIVRKPFDLDTLFAAVREASQRLPTR